MNNRIQTSISDKIRKLELLRDLLADPEIATMARSILSPKSSTAANVSEPSDVNQQPPRKTRRAASFKRGALIRSVSDILKTATSPMSAKEVMHILEQRNFHFSAEKKQVAVSKALRSLHKKKKINAEKKGNGPKAPIFYWKAGAGANLFPVQETTH